MNGYRAIAIVLAMGGISVTMILLRCVHPPAAASALIAAMGYLENTTQIFGMLAAVILLVFEAYIFSRVLGGLPYPIWKADPKTARMYGVLAGTTPKEDETWSKRETRLFKTRH